MQKHKIIAAIIALPAAILLWLYVVTVVSPNSTRTVYNIPITFEGSIVLEERDLVMTSGNETVNLEISGDRVSLKKLSNENIKVIADVSKITEAGNYSLTLSVVYPDVSGSGTFEIVRKSKSEIAISVTKILTRTFPVELDTAGADAKEGFFFDSSNAVATPAEITISGPDYEVEAITKAVVDCSDIADLEETLIENRVILFRKDDGSNADISEYVSVSQTEASVTIPIQKYKELKLRVDVKDGGGASQADVDELIFSDETIRVRGSKSQIDKLEDVLTVGTIDLAKVLTNYDTKLFKIVLPGGIKNVSGLNEVEVSIRLKGLRTQTYMVFADKIKLLNTPPNASVSINTEKIPVKLRGPEADIGALNVNDIHISLDLSGVTESGEVLAVVEINGYPAVAVIEDVFVDVIVN